MDSVHCLIVSPRSLEDPRSGTLLADAHALGFTSLVRIQANDLYWIEGDLSHDQLERLASELLCDPVAQTYCWRERAPAQAQVIEIALRPGVTDTTAEHIVRGAHELGIAGVRRSSTGHRFVLSSLAPLSVEEMEGLARRLLANPVIQHYALGPIAPSFPLVAEPSDRVLVLPVRGLDDAKLLALSVDRRAALDLNEMRAIQSYFAGEGRDPTDVEIETIAQTWSEHCSHKTFKAAITFVDGKDSGSLDAGLLKSHIRAATDKINAPWVRSAFVDNAGIIDFDDEYEVSFKVETHNHPSAIEPFGGANTGIGGVIRDVLGVSAKPIAATDVLCFGLQETTWADLPEGVLHPRRIRSGVVAGIQDYGNKIGIPTVNGAVWYDPGFTANPLVFCGCVGIAPKDRHTRSPQPGDRIIVIGGRTGRDGLRGATFSSMTMDAETGEVAGASVQIGDPITEKGAIEVLVRARDMHLYHAVTDCGAGGLSSAVGEMSRQIGAAVDLNQVRTKYPGLEPWEIWLSEAQERMVLATPAESVHHLQELCDTFDVELNDIGVFTGDNRLVVRRGGQSVLDLSTEFLFDGMPKRSLTARIPSPSLSSSSFLIDDPSALLLRLLSHPNISSKADIIRVYDHEVQGGTVIKPLTGAHNDGPSDACVIKPLGTKGTRGIALANGINAEYGKLDPYRMALSVVDEAIRNAVAVGADPSRIALLDNFCWGDPLREETMGGLAEAARGCHDAALHFGTPFISGKDSLNNEYVGTDHLRHAIPPTLLISAIGIVPDVQRAVTMDFKVPGDVIYLIGDWMPEFGGSHAAMVTGSKATRVPDLPPHAPSVYRSLHRAIQLGLVRACHDLSEGGLAVALAEMCIAGRRGCQVTLSEDDPLLMFGETNGCLLVAVHPSNTGTFAECLHDIPSDLIRRLGEVTKDPVFTIDHNARPLVSIDLESLVKAWNRTEVTSR